MPKVILYMAMSVNGIVARESGEEDFLSDANWETFKKLVKKHRNFIIGRKTYEAVKTWAWDFGFDDFTDAEKVVISNDPSFSPDSGYTAVPSPQKAIEHLSKKGFKSCLVTGGPTINSLFAKEALLDEIFLNVEPALIGKGIPLFAKEDFELRAKLVSAKKGKDDLLTLHYQILK